MSREIREQLDLEELWGRGADLTWYQQGPPALTLDTIGAETTGEDGSSDGDVDSWRDSLVSDGMHDDGAREDSAWRRESEGRRDADMHGSPVNENNRR